MTCANHPEVEATAFCRECGKPMCLECQRPAMGSVFCAEHVAAAAESVRPAYGAPPPPPPPIADPVYVNSPYTAPIPPRPSVAGGSPALAFILGFLIPGVGAIFNGQYVKGLVHAVIFGLLVSILGSHHSSFAPLFGILLGIWVFYMAFEAYHTARKRRLGIPVDEFSSMIELKPANGRFPVGAIILIGLGFILLLDSTDVISLVQLERFWPVGLIVLGLYLLYNRVTPSSTRAAGESAQVGR